VQATSAVSPGCKLYSPKPTGSPELLTDFPFSSIFHFHCIETFLFTFTHAFLPNSFPFFRRTDIRTMYDIRGNVLGDCGRAFCCMPCTLILNEKEVVYRQSLQPADKTGYQAVPDMTAGQQQ
jgi:Cys-rich protein (TIGR01571 family)